MLFEIDILVMAFISFVMWTSKQSVCVLRTKPVKSRKNEKKNYNVLKIKLGLLFQRQIKYNYAISYTEQVNVYAHER